MHPDILNDYFSRKLRCLVFRPDVLTILEIGCGAGNGSTIALCAGIQSGQTDQNLWCLEWGPERFEELRENVDFLKMDVKGAELVALKKAEQTTRRWGPKMAVAIYHRIRDFGKFRIGSKNWGTIFIFGTLPSTNTKPFFPRDTILNRKIYFFDNVLSI